MATEFMRIKVELELDMAEMVQRKLAAGLYASVDELVCAALRLMDQADQIQAAKLKGLQQDVQDGLSSGTATDWDADVIKRAGRARRAAKNDDT